MNYYTCAIMWLLYMFNVLILKKRARVLQNKCQKNIRLYSHWSKIFPNFELAEQIVRTRKKPLPAVASSKLKCSLIMGTAIFLNLILKSSVTLWEGIQSPGDWVSETHGFEFWSPSASKSRPCAREQPRLKRKICILTEAITTAIKGSLIIPVS